MRKQLIVPARFACQACLACLVCLTTAGTARADLVGTWKTEKNDSLKISYRDEQHIRMEAGPDAYILVSMRGQGRIPGYPSPQVSREETRRTLYRKLPTNWKMRRNRKERTPPSEI